MVEIFEFQNFDAGLHRDQRLGFGARAQGRVQISAVGCPIWCSVARLDPCAQWQARQFVSCRAIANAQGIGRCYAVLQQIGDAEGSKNSHAVRADLNTGAFFGKDGAAFADVRCDAASCKCERRCEAPDAAACNHGARSTCCHECMLTVAALRALVASGCVRYEAALWVALIGFKTRIVNIKCRTIRAQDLAVLSHIQVDMRMIERGAGAHAIELFNANEDALGADVVGEMRDQCSGHAVAF